jgi:hypothetical protein
MFLRFYSMSEQDKYRNEFALQLQKLSGRMKEMLPRYSELKQKETLSSAEQAELSKIAKLMDVMENRIADMQRMLSDANFGYVTAIYYTLKGSFKSLGPEWDALYLELRESYRSVLRKRSQQALN